MPTPCPAAPTTRRHNNRVVSITGNVVTLARPLPWSIDSLAWRPAIRATTSRRLGGVESLTIEFGWSMYPGVDKELNYNAISIAGMEQSWVRDVEVVNADSGVQLLDSSAVTVSGLTMRTTKKR